MIIEGNIIKIAGPVIVADGMRGAQMLEMVRVGDEKHWWSYCKLRFPSIRCIY